MGYDSMVKGGWFGTLSKIRFQLLGCTKTRVTAQQEVVRYQGGIISLPGFDTIGVRLMDVKANLAAGDSLWGTEML